MTIFAVPPVAPSLTLVELFGPLAALAPIALGIGFAALAASLVAASWRSRRGQSATIQLETSSMRSAA